MRRGAARGLATRHVTEARLSTPMDGPRRTLPAPFDGAFRNWQTGVFSARRRCHEADESNCTQVLDALSAAAGVKVLYPEAANALLTLSPRSANRSTGSLLNTNRT